MARSLNEALRGLRKQFANPAEGDMKLGSKIKEVTAFWRTVINGPTPGSRLRYRQKVKKAIEG